MWPVLFNRKFLTIVQVDPPIQMANGIWAINLLDIRGAIHTALYRRDDAACRAYTAFHTFAARPLAYRGLCIWVVDREIQNVEIREG